MEFDEERLGLVGQAGFKDDFDLPESRSPFSSFEQGDCVMNGIAHVDPKHDSSISADVDENESAEVTHTSSTAVEEEKLKDLSPELQEGLKILNYFLNDRKFEDFRDDVFCQLTEPAIEKYKKEIQDPMWLFRMKAKFVNDEYVSITQVVSDFQLMVYNCQRFNGLNHPISKKAAKMDIILKQKLNLLRSDIRCKIAQDNTMPWLAKNDNQDTGLAASGLRKRTANHRLDDSSAMLNQLRIEEEQKAKEERRLKKEEQRAAQVAAQKDLIDWEEKNLTVEPIKSIIRHSWELPQIGLFLFLCQEVLVLDEVPLYELERCLAIPRQSRRLQQIMTALLSTPCQREKRSDKGLPDMPYAVWTSKLREVVNQWYRVLDTCCGDLNRAAIKLGLVQQTFQVLGTKNPLHDRLFHHLNFYTKIWILKSVCDHLVEKEERLRSVIESKDPMDQRGLLLGTDRHGNQYIHFPQFCGPDLRVYRQKRPPVPVVKEEAVESECDDDLEEEEIVKVKLTKARSGAKRKLNLDSSNSKRSRSATPLNDSETEGTVSPAPSEPRTKSLASSSRHSSPLPRETNSRSRQSSARNSPAPETLSLDSLPYALPSGKGRKTRNSAESNFFANVDLEALLRQRSRRSRAARNAAREAMDAESVSTVGDESSQDGLPADTAPTHLHTDVKMEVDMVNGDVKAESGLSHSQGDIKIEPGLSQGDLKAECGPAYCPGDVKMESGLSQQDLKAESGSLKCQENLKVEPDLCLSQGQEQHPDCLHGQDGKLLHSLACGQGTSKSKAASQTVCVKEEAGCSERSGQQDGEIRDTSLRNSCDIKHDESVKQEPCVTAEHCVSATASDCEQSFVTCDTHQSACVGKPSIVQFSTCPSSHPQSSSSHLVPTSSHKQEGSAVDCDLKTFQTSPDGCSPEGTSTHIPQTKSEVKRERSENCYDVQSESNRTSSHTTSCDPVKSESYAAGLVPAVNDMKREKGDQQGEETREAVMKTEIGQRRTEEGVSEGSEPNTCDTNTSGEPPAADSLMDHAEEEMMSNPGEFELVAEDMEGLEALIRHFDPDHITPSPHPSPSARPPAKRQKQKSTPKTPKRWVCEEDLHKRLLRMLGELQPYRSKLAAFNKKARLKLQREMQNFVEETPKEEDVKAWESEQSDSEQNSDDSEAEESACDAKDSDDPAQVPLEASTTLVKPKTPSKAASTCSAESLDPEHRDIEEYEADVSSRGRLRKRRLIPNNSEDQGVKKKKGGKKTDEVTPPETPSNPLSSLVQRSDDGGIILNLSNNEFFAMLQEGGTAATQLVQQLAAIKTTTGQTLTMRPQGIKVVGGPAPLASTDTRKPSSQQSTSHPVMQKILSSHSPVSVRSESNAAHKKETVAVSSSSISNPSSATLTSPYVSRASGNIVSVAGSRPSVGNPLLMTASVKGGKQQLFVVTPQQQEELMRSGVLRCQTPRQPLQAASSLTKPQTLGPHNTISVKPSPFPNTPQARHEASTAQKGQGSKPGHTSPQSAAMSASLPHNVSVMPAQAMLAAGAPLVSPKEVGVGGVPALKIVRTTKGQEVVGVPVVVSQVMKAPVIVNNSSGTRTLILQSGRALPRYAGNVTVKELLENRAANKSDEDKTPDSTSTSPPTSSHGRIETTSVPATFPLTIVTTTAHRTGGTSSSVQRVVRLPSQSALDDALQTVGTSSSVQRVVRLPSQSVLDDALQTVGTSSSVQRVVRLPSQSALDHALQTVVTSYHTTLPTADIKVPSPTTLPSLSPRKNITRIVQSTKAPIPTTTKVQAKHSPVVLTSALLPASSSALPSAAHRIVSGVVSANRLVKPGTVVMGAGGDGGEPVVVQVIPRGASGTGNVVQGYVLPQGGATRSLQFAGVRGGTSSLDNPGVSHNIASVAATCSQGLPSSTVMSAASSPFLPPSQGLLMTVPSPHTGPVSGSSRTTSDMLKSMLVAKGVTLPSPTPPTPLTALSASTVLHAPIPVSASATPTSSMPASVLKQPALTQMSRVIKAPLGSAHPVLLGPQGAGGPGGITLVPQTSQPTRVVQTPGGTHLHNLVTGLAAPVTGLASPIKGSGVPGVVRMALPPGMQVAGGTAMRLVAGAHPGSAGNMQPVLASLKPGAAHTLQQLQVVAGGIPGLQLKAQPPSTKAGQSVGQGVVGGLVGQGVGLVKDQKTGQLCLSVQPSGQGVQPSGQGVVTPLSTSPSQPGVQGAALTVVSPAPQGSTSVLGPTSVSASGCVSKVIMATPTLPVTTSTPPLHPSLSNTPAITPSMADSRLSMSVTPGPQKSQFIISPFPSQSPGDVLQQVLTQKQTESGQSHSLPSNDNTPCLDSGNSRAVLASLSHMVLKSQGAAGGDAGTACRGSTGVSAVQPMLMRGGAGDNSASSTLLNLAAHVSPAPSTPLTVSTATQGSHPTPLMMAFATQAAVRPQQAAPQKQLVAVRRIGGQLLTENNLPVTETNGEYKILPKATLQIGSQTVTVFSPSSAMIHNLRPPSSSHPSPVTNLPSHPSSASVIPSHPSPFTPIFSHPSPHTNILSHPIPVTHISSHPTPSIPNLSQPLPGAPILSAGSGLAGSVADSALCGKLVAASSLSGHGTTVSGNVAATTVSGLTVPGNLVAGSALSNSLAASTLPGSRVPSVLYRNLTVGSTMPGNVAVGSSVTGNVAGSTLAGKPTGAAVSRNPTGSTLFGALTGSTTLSGNIVGSGNMVGSSMPGNVPKSSVAGNITTSSLSGVGAGSSVSVSVEASPGSTSGSGSEASSSVSRGLVRTILQPDRKADLVLNVISQTKQHPSQGTPAVTMTPIGSVGAGGLTSAAHSSVLHTLSHTQNATPGVQLLSAHHGLGFQTLSHTSHSTAQPFAAHNTMFQTLSHTSHNTTQPTGVHDTLFQTHTSHNTTQPTGVHDTLLQALSQSDAAVGHTPHLKARLEQPRIDQSPSLATVNGVGHRQSAGGGENGVGGGGRGDSVGFGKGGVNVGSVSVGGVSVGGVSVGGVSQGVTLSDVYVTAQTAPLPTTSCTTQDRVKGSSNDVEEEAALNLLTLANQVVL